MSVIGFTLFYFSYAFRRAAGKYFWYDELYTVYLCRLPTIGKVLEAVRAGVDFNPPLFYILTRASNAAFGEGLIATRLPGIFGFWVACLSIFCFVNHAYGPGAGFVSMVLPMTTGALHYACEARSHGIILGFLGLALVCWQRSSEQMLPNHWLLAFSLFLLAAFMTHCYALLIAIPFALAELFGIISFRHVSWAMWIATVTPAIAACLSFVPSIRAYRRLTKDTTWATLFAARLSEVEKAYTFLFDPSIPILLVAIVLFALDRPTHVLEAPQIVSRQMVLAIGFLAVPIFAVILGKAVGGPYLPRYCISAIFGFSVLFGTGIGIRNIPNWLSVILTAMAIVLAVKSAAGGSVTCVRGDPLSIHPLLRGNPVVPLAIVVLDPLDFLYLTHYAMDLAPRLYYLSLSEKDIHYRGFENLRKWCFLECNQTLTMDEFLRLDVDFSLYGSAARLVGGLFVAVAPGRRMKSLIGGRGRFLAEIEVSNSPRSGSKLLG